MSISIIGFGRFGQFMASHLKPFDEILVAGRRDMTAEAAKIGVTAVDLKTAAEADIVILGPPMEKFEEVLKQIVPYVKPNALVLDVCSLKMHPVSLMKKLLPDNVDILATHPLFGPQSATENITDMRIALFQTRVSDERFDRIKKFCEKHLKLKTYVTTPEEHDKQMALSQALTHFIGQAVDKMGIKRVELSTKTFDDLMDIVEIIHNDSRALFENMQTMNPYAQEIREHFVKTSKSINNHLNTLENND